jgi:Nuclease-related domain
MQSAAACGVAGLSAGALAAIAADGGAIPIAGALVLVMVGLLFRARHWIRLAGRSRVGARSEDEVRRALAPLEPEGWRLRHSLPYRGRGDIDSVAIAPTRIAFAIETKTRTFDARHLAGVLDMAAWLYGRRRRWCRRGALPVLCIARARRGTSPGSSPGRVARPPRSVTPSGRRNLTAPRFPGRGHGNEDVIATVAELARTPPSVESVCASQTLAVVAGARVGGGKQTSGVRMDVGERTHDDTAGAPEFAVSRAPTEACRVARTHGRDLGTRGPGTGGSRFARIFG